MWCSRHGLPDFNEWHEFVSTELLSRSYLQWCAENRVQRPMTRVQLGHRMSAIYAPIRPRGKGIIIGEVEAATKTVPGVNRSGFIADDLVIRADRPPGYMVSGLENARARFVEARGVAGEWDGLPEEPDQP